MGNSAADQLVRVAGRQTYRLKRYSDTYGERVKRPTCPKCGYLMLAAARTATGKIRWQCVRRESGARIYCYSSTDPGSETRRQNGNKKPRPAVFKRPLRETAEVYIITAAQNATPVHPVFWGCLQTIARHRRAELMVIPLRYKNPTSRWTASQANEENWVAEVQPFLWNQRKVLNPNLVLLGDVKTQPTATSPLTGFDAISGSSSAILGHTKMQLRSIPVPSGRMAKILTTTGAVTVPNYTDSRAGKLGHFHHTLAAVIVEIVGKTFHLRQLNFDTRTESVTDLDTRYYESRHARAPAALALVMGDTHVDFISPDVERATFGPDGIVKTLRPQHLVWHDLLDGYSVNPHHHGNPFNAIAKHAGHRSSVIDEVKRAARFVKDHTPDNATSVVVDANHDRFLSRWILSHDWKTDPENAEFYLRCALEMVQKTKLGPGGTEYPSPFAMVFPTIVDMSRIRLLRADESFVLDRTELGMHGDRGPNGSRGTLRNHRRLGIRSIIGHSHSPGIEEGAISVGTSTRLRLEYNGGPSSWLNAHCVLHADGRRQLILIIDGEYRLRRRA